MSTTPRAEAREAAARFRSVYADIKARIIK
jgi:hypothetical protein